jgi:flagellar hook-associated protein 1 FlgK
MRSTFMGLEVGRRSLMAAQTSLDVTGHNVANANTEGYTRQEALLTATRPYHAPALWQYMGAGQLGTGVKVEYIRRLRDGFLDGQIRNENKSQGYWSAMQNSMCKIEVIVNEPSENGLRAVMDQYWQAWQDLVESPESESVRAVVAQRGAAVADTFNHLYRQCVELRSDLNDSVAIKVNEINSIASQIRDLNGQILAVRIAGKQPNDLMDKRDLLIDQLSGLVNISVYEDTARGTVTVQLGGRSLVSGVESSALAVKADIQGLYSVVWADTGTRAEVASGELGGLLDARGGTANPEDAGVAYRDVIPNMIAKLNLLAQTMVEHTNALHRAGYGLATDAAHPGGFTGLDFFVDPSTDPAFDGNWAQFMQVNGDLLDDPTLIAAAAAPTWALAGGAWVQSNFGDGGNALAIARLKQAQLVGTASVDDYWRSLASDVGIQAQETGRMVENQQALLAELESKRQSVSGVSLDEEMTNMIRFQHAYNAAARYITAVDEALDVIVNRMGLVGR